MRHGGEARSLKRRNARLLRFSPGKLKVRRLDLGLFQWQVAERCGWKATKTYARLEAGQCARTAQHVLDRVAEALQCSVEDLLARRKPRRK
jgi:DNA-binding Xre family transcriptional regulator